MISSILCWWGIHHGKWGTHQSTKRWSTQQNGTVTITYLRWQERYCKECNAWEEREVTTGEETLQPWSATYAQEVAKLGK